MKLDLKEWIAKVTGQTEFKTLLWTNPNPSQGFSPQTVLNNGELSGYDAIEVYATFLEGNAPSTIGGYCKANVGGAGIIQFVNLSTDNTSNASTFLNNVARTFTVSESGGVTFANGQMTYIGGAYPNWANRAVPQKIYGIRYVGG